MKRFEELAKEIKQIADFYGYEHQKLKAAEECAELIQALMKDDKKHITEEAADVLVMLIQVIYLLDVPVLDFMAMKIDRQKARIRKEISENEEHRNNIRDS